MPSKKAAARMQLATFKRPKTVIMYASAFVGIMVLVAIGYSSSQTNSSSSQQNSVASAASNTSTVSSPDQQAAVSDVVATSIAADVAQSSDLPVANNVENLATSLTAKQSLDQSQSDASVITKPQIVDPTQRQSIITYTTKTGDSVDSVAAAYGLTKNTIKWANNLTSDALEPGTKLQILPVDGTLYTVKDGDTEDSIAAKYQVDKDRLVTFNNLDLSNIKPGMQLVLPAAQLPTTEQPGYQAPATLGTSVGASGSGVSITSSFYSSGSVGNRYAYGWCTYYAYDRRAALGRPVGSFWGNASTWAAAAAAAGYQVDHSPEVGAVLQSTYGGGGYGHVAVVESINSDGSVTVSEMNYTYGWNRTDTRTISAGEARSYNYIH